MTLTLFKFKKTCNILSGWAYCEVFNIQFQLLLQLGQQLGVKQLQLVTKKENLLEPEHQQVLITIKSSDPARRKGKTLFWLLEMFSFSGLTTSSSWTWICLWTSAI